MGLFCCYCYHKSLYYSMTVGKCASCCVIEMPAFLLPDAFEWYPLILIKSFQWKNLLQIATMTLRNFTFDFQCRMFFSIFIVKYKRTVGFWILLKHINSRGIIHTKGRFTVVYGCLQHHNKIYGLYAVWNILLLVYLQCHGEIRNIRKVQEHETSVFTGNACMHLYVITE